VAQSLIAVNHFRVTIVIIQQFLKCRCHTSSSTTKDFLLHILYLHSFLITVTLCGKVFQGKCGSSAEKSYNIISIFLVKSLKKLLVRQKVFFGTLCYINMNFNHSSMFAKPHWY